MNSQAYAALLEVTATLLNPDADQSTLRSSIEKIDDWQDFAAQAERHGLSVMLGQLAKQGAITIPRLLDLQLKALTIRHQKILAARVIVMKDVIEVFDQQLIEFALLKGAALSQLIYAPAWLRPMRDIDIIVRRDQASQAQSLLRTIGFENEDSNAGYLFEHHHLPNSTRIQDGFCISLEVHHDALSGDVSASISLDDLTENLQAFELANSKVYAFGHIDMLKHLCHHTFEPAQIIKLGSILDLTLYANTYAHEIDWAQLEKTQPNIVNSLRCIHALIPLPEKLKTAIGGPFNDHWQPKGLGESFIPLSQILGFNSKREKLRAMFAPSAWWMHIFYTVPPQKSLFLTYFFTHPLTLAKWVYRRYRAAQKSRAA